MKIARQNSLWQDQAFVLFWLARTISLVGAAITLVVLPILVFRITGSAFFTSLTVTFQVLPYFFFGFIAGAVADRVNRKRMMVSCDFINALLIATIPVADVLNILTLPHIFAVSLISASVFVWFDAANFGALPTLVGREKIVEANSLIWTVTIGSQIVGPSVGGWLAFQVGPAIAMSINALSYFLSACFLLIIKRPFNSERPVVTGSIVRRTLSEIAEGLRFIWRQPLVRVMTLTGFGNSFSGGAVTGLLVIYAVQGLQLPKEDARIGWLFSAGAVGSLIFSLLLPRLSKIFRMGYITLIGLIANPILMVGLALATNFWLGLVLYVIWNGCYFMVIINGITLRQLVTPDHLLSRVNISARMIAWGGAPFGAAVGGFLAELTNIQTTFIIMALGAAIAAAAGWFSPLRTDDATTDKTKVDQELAV